MTKTCLQEPTTWEMLTSFWLQSVLPRTRVKTWNLRTRNSARRLRLPTGFGDHAICTGPVDPPAHLPKVRSRNKLNAASIEKISSCRSSHKLRKSTHIRAHSRRDQSRRNSVTGDKTLIHGAIFPRTMVGLPVPKVSVPRSCPG